MAVVCPTVTAYEPHAYRTQMETLEPFAERIHIDLMDDEFTSHKSVSLEQVWWPDNAEADIHLMYKRPMDYLEHLIKLKPSLVIWHFEAEGDHAHMATHLHDSGIKTGIALLQDTPPEKLKDILDCFDQVLIFSGNLGEHGGFADLRLLDKVQPIREQKALMEISWDGGINDQNAQALMDGGIDVLNVGGYIHNSPDPETAFTTLQQTSN